VSGGYIVIEHDAMDDVIGGDSTHGLASWAVFCHLVRRAGPDGTCWPSIADVADGTRLSRATVKRALRSLTQRGIIDTVQRGRRTVRRILRHRPQWLTDAPHNPKEWLTCSPRSQEWWHIDEPEVAHLRATTWLTGEPRKNNQRTITKNNNTPPQRSLPLAGGDARIQGGETISDEFDEFWRAYPRKVGKRAAQKAYCAALKRADAAAILQGVRVLAKEFAARPPDQLKFCPHPSTWLNADRWEDAPVTAEAPPPLLKPVTCTKSNN